MYFWWSGFLCSTLCLEIPSCSCMQQSIIFNCWMNILHFVYFTADSHLDYFHVRAIMNNSGTTMALEELIYVFLLGEYVGLKLQVHGGCMCLVIVDTDRKFPKVVVLIYTPTIRVWEFSACRLSFFPLVVLIIHWHCQMSVGWLAGWIVDLATLVVVWWAHIVVSISTSLLIEAIEYIFIFFGYLGIFFCEVTVQVFSQL